MQIFLSYASEDRAMAEAIALRLRGIDNDVFFDRDTLVGGETYDNKIASQIGDSDLFVFLLSPHSIAQGRYTLTELAIARARWPNPNRRVLPVVIKQVNFADVPAYLKAANALTFDGNIPAELAFMVERDYGRPRASVAMTTLGCLGLLTGMSSGYSIFTLLGPGKHLSDVQSIFHDVHDPLIKALLVGQSLLPGMLLGLALGFGLWRWAGRRWSAFPVSVATITLGNAIAFGLLSAFGHFDHNSREAWVMLHVRYAILGLTMAFATSVAVSIMSPKFRQAELVALVVTVGTIAGVLAMSMMSSLTKGPAQITDNLRLYFPFVMALWQGLVCATVGYGLSREPRPN